MTHVQRRYFAHEAHPAPLLDEALSGAGRDEALPCAQRAVVVSAPGDVGAATVEVGLVDPFVDVTNLHAVAATDLGADHLPLTDLAEKNRSVRMDFDALGRQPRRILNSPCWSGIIDAGRTYTAYALNVERLVPWRTVTETSIQPSPSIRLIEADGTAWLRLRHACRDGGP